jgi:type IV pilus assembly protein PilC
MNLSLNTLFNGISTRDRAFFMRQFAIMITSGITLSHALNMMSQQTTNKNLKQAIMVMTRDVENGHPFSVAASRFPAIFDPVSLSMLKTGEASGQMNVILTEIADHVENSMQFTNKVRNALLYPSFVIIVMFIVGIILTTVIIPRITAIFEDTSATLPFATRLLMGISNFVINFWYILLLALVGAVVGLRSYFITPSGRETLYEMQMHIPVVKNLILSSYLTRLTSVLSMLIKAGVPFTDSLRIVAETMPSKLWVQTLYTVREEVERGIPLSAAFSRHSIIPVTLTQMVAVGEQTGKLDEVLDNLAVLYEDQTNTAIKAVTTLIEPVILMVVAVGVAFVVIAVIVPIYNLAEQV